MRKRALRETLNNARYQWFGEQPHWRARQLVARARLMVLSSKIEGGARVIAEALASNVPILASHVSGNIGLLGDDYPGYFEYGDTTRLTELMQRAETDLKFYRQLKAACKARSFLVKPARERGRWRELLRQISS